MKRGRLEMHLKAKYSAYVNFDLIYFKPLKAMESLFNVETVAASRILEANYDISLLIAKSGKIKHGRI